MGQLGKWVLLGNLSHFEDIGPFFSSWFSVPNLEMMVIYFDVYIGKSHFPLPQIFYSVARIWANSLFSMRHACIVECMYLIIFYFYTNNLLLKYNWSSHQISIYSLKIILKKLLKKLFLDAWILPNPLPINIFIIFLAGVIYPTTQIMNINHM